MADLIANGEKLAQVRAKLNATLNPYPSRADFEASIVPGAVLMIYVIEAGDVYRLVRDPGGDWVDGGGGAWQAAIEAGLADGDLQAAVDGAQAWADGDGEPGGPGTKSSKKWAEDAGQSAADALASKIEAELYDGPKIDTISELSSVTTVPVGGYLRIISLSAVLQRVSSGGHYVFGSVRWNVLRRNGVWPVLAFSPAADGTTNDAATIDAVNGSGDVVDLGGRSYRYSGTFAPVAAFINGQIIDNSRTWDYRIGTGETAPTVGQRRGRGNYVSTTVLRVDGIADQIAMGGFRIFGQYLKSRGRLVSTGLGAASHKLVSISTDLNGITSPQLANWYGVFFCANPSDTTGSFKLVPYLRALSRSGNVVTLAAGGENQNVSPTAATYTVPTNAWAGVDCLVINQGGVWSGRRTTITANTTTTVTLADGTGIGALDFLLPAPAGFTDYHYLASGYYESPGDWRNMADDGVSVRSRMTTVAEVLTAGAASNAKIRFGGNISPLATGYIGSLNQVISTESTGTVAETLSHDSSSHDVWRCFFDKDVGGPGSQLNGNYMVDLSFSSEQAAWHSTTGTLASAVVSRSLLTYGWREL